MTGSRWWFPVREGLLDPEHIVKMGAGLPLFLYCLKYATVAQDGGTFRYNHIEAARELGAPERTVKRWFEHLQQHQYITIRRRAAYHLEVVVAKFGLVEGMSDTGSVSFARSANIGTSEERHAKSGTSLDERSVKNGTSLDERSVKNGTSQGAEVPREVPREVPKMALVSITNKLISYQDPEGLAGANRAISLASGFQGFLEQLRTSVNKPALLREWYLICFGGPEAEAPEYGYLGKVGRAVGGAGRLAEIMWQLATKPPTGDVLDYILAQHRMKAKGNGKRDEPLGFAAIREVFGQEEQHGQ